MPSCGGPPCPVSLHNKAKLHVSSICVYAGRVKWLDGGEHCSSLHFLVFVDKVLIMLQLWLVITLMSLLLAGTKFG
jgi:hypothetical protein